MGLACSQARLLTLTTRKANCEYGLTVGSMRKMALTREMSELSQEYHSRLQEKQISYFANGQYNKVNYEYLMGYGSNYASIWNSGKYNLKDENSMILTDYNGRVVLNNDYANAITSVLGASAMDKDGRGGTFSTDKIPAMLATLCVGYATEAEFQNIIDGKDNPSSYDATPMNSLTGESTGETKVVDNTATHTEKMQAIVDFYYPIFAAAASNGWTSEYNEDMKYNQDYISDAIVSGAFQLANVNKNGEYEEGCSLNYFITTGFVEARSDADAREELASWYDAEKARISEKETLINLEMDDLSTELEAINTEIDSIKSFIDDAVSSVFDWGSG